MSSSIRKEYKCKLCGCVLSEDLEDWTIKFCKCEKLGIDDTNGGFSRVIGSPKYFEKVRK